MSKDDNITEENIYDLKTVIIILMMATKKKYKGKVRFEVLKEVCHAMLNCR